MHARIVLYDRSPKYVCGWYFSLRGEPAPNFQYLLPLSMKVRLQFYLVHVRTYVRTYTYTPTIYTYTFINNDFFFRCMVYWVLYLPS